MKPECEKSRWEKFKDGCKKVGEWCKEHWKAAITIVIVIAAVILVTTGVGSSFPKWIKVRNSLISTL